MKKILVVCLGNICRSPMAEGVLRHLAQQNKIRVEFDSAGTGNYHVGEKPDQRAIQAMEKYNIDISGLRARQFCVEDFDRFDHILVMDKTNLRDVLRLSPSPGHSEKVSMFLESIFPGEQKDVPDPWFGNDNGFHDVYRMLEKASSAFLSKFSPQRAE